MAIDLKFSESGSGPPVVIAHGLFGMGRNWAGIARPLSETHRVFCVDVRNHGESPWDDEMTYAAMAEDLARFIDAHCGSRAAVIGHSMGGKAAMVLALTDPGKVERLAVVDIAPVPYDHDYEAHLSAMANLNIAALTRRSEAEAALLEALDDIFLTRFLIRNLKADPAGHGFTWGVNLAALAAHIDDLLDFPVFEADEAYEGPALFLTGGVSAYVQPYHQAEIERLFPAADLSVIEGGGHWVHADRPDDVTSALKSFLA